MEILNILKIIFCDRGFKIDTQDFDTEKEFWQVSL